MKNIGVLLLLALVSQQPDEIRELQLDQLRTHDNRPIMELISVQAVHEDGSPARGTISCDGLWQKFDEKPTSAWNYPFKTDSRGVAVFNPWIGMFDDRDGQMHCTSEDIHGHFGTATWSMPASHAEIVVR